MGKEFVCLCFYDIVIILDFPYNLAISYLLLNSFHNHQPEYNYDHMHLVKKYVQW